MSLTSRLGSERNILDPGPNHAKMLKLFHPILSNEELAQIKALDKQDFRSKTLSMHFDAASGVEGFTRALKELCEEAESAVNSGTTFVVLSDRGTAKDQVPIPALLAVGAVHHYLTLKRVRYKTGIIVETGEAREITHFCLLVSYGAGAINPYLAIETIEQMIQQKELPEELTLKKLIRIIVRPFVKECLKFSRRWEFLPYKAIAALKFLRRLDWMKN